ncbi:MAG: ATP-binding protein [Planctomycetota bacterium]
MPTPSDTDHRFPVWPCLAVVGLTLTMMAVLALETRHSLATIQSFEERELAIERVCGRILHLDEVLTMSARMGAETGDGHWEQRYYVHVPQLDDAIALATRLAPDASEAEGSRQTDAANQRLVALEEQAFELVRQGSAAEARALLNGTEYSENKRIYSDGMRRTLSSMRSRVARLQRDCRRRAQASLLALLAGLPLLGLLWFALARTLRTHVRFRTENEESLRRNAQELEQSNRKVKEAHRAKGDFLARMSHEIRTPMNGVLGMSELLEDTELSSDQAGLVATIRGSGQALLAVIDDILDYSKIEAGKLRVHPLSFDPLRVSREALTVVEASAASRGLTLRHHREGAPFQVLADEGRLRQILLNLIGNAVKFTEEGAVEVFLRAESGEGVLEVRDTGIGIAPELLENIFGDFEQVEQASHSHKGTGLGLAISRELARLMNGEITVTSEVGRGSAFTVRLPLAISSVEGAEPADDIPAALPSRSWRVLVVDDHAVNQLLAQRMCEKLGCSATVTADGLECLEALRSESFDVVLMDCHMPNMDGLEATRRIRSTPDRHQDIPIIAMTASAFPGDIEACEAAGMSDFLSKPFSSKELAAVLARSSAQQAAIAQERSKAS